MLLLLLLLLEVAPRPTDLPTDQRRRQADRPRQV